MSALRLCAVFVQLKALAKHHNFQRKFPLCQNLQQRVLMNCGSSGEWSEEIESMSPAAEPEIMIPRRYVTNCAFLRRFQSRVWFCSVLFGVTRFAHIGNMNWLAQFCYFGARVSEFWRFCEVAALFVQNNDMPGHNCWLGSAIEVFRVLWLWGFGVSGDERACSRCM